MQSEKMAQVKVVRSDRHPNQAGSQSLVRLLHGNEKPLLLEQIGYNIGYNSSRKTVFPL